MRGARNPAIRVGILGFMAPIWARTLVAVWIAGAWGVIQASPVIVSASSTLDVAEVVPLTLGPWDPAELSAPSGVLRRRVAMPAQIPPPPAAEPAPEPVVVAPPPPPAPPALVKAPAVRGCGNPDGSKVLLTFDDGGDQAPAILDVLNRYGVKARWFPTGQWAGAHGDFMARLTQDGQLLGNHSYSHPRMLAPLGVEALRREVAQGYHPSTVFRFPYGASDATSQSVVTSMGYSICGWSIDTRDWQGQSAQAIVDLVTGQAAPGAVVLMHLRFPADVEALPRIIEDLRRRGLI